MQVSVCRSFDCAEGCTDEVTVLLGTYPHMSIAPLAQLAQFLDFRVRVLDIILDWETRGIIDANIAA